MSQKALDTTELFQDRLNGSPSPRRISARLHASVGTPWQFETNVLYDMPDRKMRARTEILRIRDYGAGGRDP
jgi:adenylate cyclase class IV